MQINMACLINKAMHLRSFSVLASNRLNIKIGDTLPKVELYKETPNAAVNIHKLFKNKKGILFSIVGAFTPGCTQAHIPEYINNVEKFKEEGIETIVCVTVNDPFVTEAWSKTIDPEGKLTVLADPSCAFTKAMGMDLDCTLLLGNVRSKRYSLIIENNIVRNISMDPDASGLACLLCLQTMKWEKPKVENKSKV